MAKYKSFTFKLPRPKANAQVVFDYSINVFGGITANADVFENPNPTLSDLKVANDDLELSLKVTEDQRNGASKDLMEKRRLKVLELLGLLAAYVIGVSKGDRSIAKKSGFVLSKEESESKPQTVFKVETTRGEEDGTAELKVTVRGGNDMFKVYREIEGKWVIIEAFMGAKFLLNDLPSGTTIIRIIGFKGDVKGNTVDLVVKAN